MPNLVNKQPHGWQVEHEVQATTWQTPENWQPGQALQLAGDAEALPEYAGASAIAIEFPAFSDGRGLSLAVLLRTRLQYTGEIRATGNIHEDVLHYMVRCGFDSFELPDDRDQNIALASLAPYADQYQASVLQPEPAFRRVNRGSSA